MCIEKTLSLIMSFHFCKIQELEFDLLSPPMPHSNLILFSSQNTDSGVVLSFLSPPLANFTIDFQIYFLLF